MCGFRTAAGGVLSPLSSAIQSKARSTSVQGSSFSASSSLWELCLRLIVRTHARKGGLERRRRRRSHCCGLAQMKGGGRRGRSREAISSLKTPSRRKKGGRKTRTVDGGASKKGTIKYQNLGLQLNGYKTCVRRDVPSPPSPPPIWVVFPRLRREPKIYAPLTADRGKEGEREKRRRAKCRTLIFHEYSLSWCFRTKAF